jgi:thiamine pyrophosphokinase
MSDLASGNPLHSVAALEKDCHYYFLSSKNRRWIGQLKKNSLISLFSLSDQTRGVTAQGVQYPLKNETLPPSSRGLSNVAKGGQVRIQIKTGRLLIALPLKGSYD